MARKWKVGELAIIHDPYDCYGLVDLEGELVVIEEISGNDYVARDRTNETWDVGADILLPGGPNCMSFNLANAAKLLILAAWKGGAVQDLRDAGCYIRREIGRRLE